jgi:outer membrane protein OmpA-like peptidoglycan-associated protein
MKNTILLIILILSYTSGFSQSTDIFSTGNFKIEELSEVNTEQSEISPFFVNDSLYYSSQGEKYYSSARAKKNIAFYNIYKQGLKLNGKLSSDTVRNLVNGFGNEYHEGPASYCERTGEMFVTKSNIESPDLKKRAFTKENIRLRLVIMKNVNGKWEETQAFPYNDSHYHYAHPAINLSGDTLIFSSDMPGGYGNSDLYMSVRKDSVWSDPVNLGAKINTSGDEMFPTFLPGGILSFSSNGRDGGYGNLDIWNVDFPEMKKVTNAGKGINSETDDFGLVVNKSKSVGYFCSNRNGGTGSDDIYMVEKTRFEITLSSKSELTKEILSNVNIEVKSDNNTVAYTGNTDENGNVKLMLKSGAKYTVFATKTNYKKATVMIDLTDNQTSDYHYQVYLLPNFMLKGIVVNQKTKTPIAGAVIRVGDNKITTDEKGAFQFPINPEMTYNLAIAANRYLGVDDSLSTVGLSTATISRTYELIPIQKGVRFDLKNIYYDLNKWDIRADAALELNKLANTLKDYPEIKIKLESHTDSRGSDSYNMWLSKKRAQSCFNYLVGKGISADRMTYQGYGETQLINHCSNGVSCTDEEHQQNRRTVVEITEGEGE